MKHYIVNIDKYSGLLLSCDICEIIIIVRKVLICFTNILLNDYTTAQRLPKYINFLEVIMPLIYFYYTVYYKLYKHYRVNRFLKYMYVHRE